MSEYILFAGTTEGRVLTERMEQAKIPALVCVATEYGEQLLPQGNYVHVRRGRMNCLEMQAILQREEPKAVIDATHPYAAEVTYNLQKACKDTGTRYVRLLRESARTEQKLVTFPDVGEAARFLDRQKGNILVTTGSKELPEILSVISDIDRIYVRILPTVENMKLCQDLGLEGRRLVCMQGPFSVKMNEAVLEHCKASWLVTKESGQTGGFLEKCEAAAKLHIPCVVIQRPGMEYGFTLEEIWQRMKLHGEKVE